MSNSFRTRVGVSTVVLASTLAMAGCGGSGSSPSADGTNDGGAPTSKAAMYQAGLVGAKDTSTAPKAGGTLTIADYAEARSLDPTKTIATGASGGTPLAAVYDELVRYDQSSGSYQPWLAQSLTPSKGNAVWTLKLRKGVTFSDGTPLNATAVLGSLGYYMKNGGFDTLALAQNIAGMKPVGADTVVFTLRAGWSSFPAMLAGGPGMILAPAAYKNPANFKPIGAGPFTLASYKPSEELVLKARPDYWKGKPHLAAVRFVWLGSDDAKLQSLKSGSVDVINVRSPKTVEAARADGYGGYMFPTGLGGMFWINNRAGHPGHDPRVRQAINAAIDPKVYLDRTVGNGVGQPSRDILAPSSRFFSGIKTAGYDPTLARKLLAEAKASGYDGKISFMGQSDPVSQAAAVTVKAMLEAVGFTVTTQQLTNISDQIQKIYVTHDYDLVASAASLSDELMYVRLATNLDSKSPQNPSGYANPQMDKLIGQLQNASGAQEKQIVTKVDELWQKTVPGVAMSAGGSLDAWNKDVHGVVDSTEQLLLLGQAWKG